jgi:hypothetical protein
MKTINENLSLVDFQAWFGAIETKQAIIDAGLVDEFDNLIEKLYPDGITETQLNDVLWFEKGWIFESLGVNNQ